MQKYHTGRIFRIIWKQLALRNKKYHFGHLFRITLKHLSYDVRPEIDINIVKIWAIEQTRALLRCSYL